MDRHKLWRRIEADYEEAKRRCPEGFHPVVTVYVAGRMEPLDLGFVRTSRDPDYPWVRFEITKGARDGASSGPLPATARWLWVLEEDVRRVELTLREKPPFDFDDYQVLPEEPDNSE